MKRASGAVAQGALSSRWFHLVVLALGSAFVLVGAFHGYIWFDESYSVAIANHSFSEIWRIGSGDVHPVLFYWALHALNLVFGQNILAYRLFTVLGSVALASLGYTHVRRDFGWKPGVLFTAFVLFIPYTAIMATASRNARGGRGFLRARRFRGGLSSLYRAWSAHTCTTLAPCPPSW